MLTDISFSFLTEVTENQNVFFDYANFRKEGIRQLEHLTGSAWTDFNEHDPGITILEQLCYALTDLAYRIDFSLPDLLSEGGANPYVSLHAPALILSSRSVTLMDLRKLVIDVEGVKNAWIEKVEDAEPVIYFQKQGLPRTDQPANLKDAKNLIYFANVSNQSNIKTDGGVVIQPRGLFRVLIEKYRDSTDSDIINKVTARLHAHRSLAMDFQSIEVLKPQLVPIKASIEITQHGNPDDIYAAILQKIADHFSPSVTFYNLAERLAANLSMEEIFDGPRLNHGFIDTEQLAMLKRKTSLRTSDLIHAIMDVDGVRMVKYLVFSKEMPWVMDLEDNKIPVLNPVPGSGHTDITLERNQLPVNVTKTYPEQVGKRAIPVGTLEPELSTGRDRKVGRYHSIQHQFPANYGVGAVGLSTTADEQRQAQVKQLKAYLLFFDQIMANSFNQLAHIKDLFGFNDSPLSTYFMDFIDDESLDLEALWITKNTDERKSKLQAQLENSKIDADLRRKNRFLDHLLARFAEPFADYSRFQENKLSSLAELARDKAAILSDYPKISSGRGTGCDVTQIFDHNETGLEQRLRLKLGITGGQVLPDSQAKPDLQEQLYLIEHILLRPTDSDKAQTAPLLADARFDDPYSLQITVVLSGNTARFTESGFQKFVEQTVHEETPAHLIAYVLWLDNSAIPNFRLAYENWLNQQSNYRSGLVQDNLSFRFRDARDTMIDLLGIGQTYPLADVPISENVTVAYGAHAPIIVSYSQKGVSYQLYDKDKKPIDVESKVDGDKLTLITKGTITDNRTFTIQATRNHGEKSLTVKLISFITVKVGLNKSLSAGFVINEFVSVVVNSGAIVVNYGKPVQIEMPESQQGVEYSLIDKKTNQTISVGNVKGKGQDSIFLTIKEVTEDIQIKILANNLNKVEKTLLDIELSLGVRANPALAVSLESSVLDYDTNAVIKIANSQESVQYSAFVRAIADNEFIRGDRKAAQQLAIKVSDTSTVQIKAPVWSLDWNPSGFISLGEAIQGNGAEIKLNLNKLEDDQLIIIQAYKIHEIKNPAGDKVTSDIQLEQSAAVLIKPNPNPALRLQATIENAVLKSPVQVLGGQPGVFYYFNTLPEGKTLGQPVYFHQQDATDKHSNKGIQDTGKKNIALEIGVDFVIAAPLPATKKSSEFPPQPPELDVDTLAVDGTTLSIRAVKAQTGLEVTLSAKLMTC